MSKRTCSIDGCNGTYQLRGGLCNKHYIQKRKANKGKPKPNKVAASSPEVLANTITTYLPLITAEAWRTSYVHAEEIIQETSMLIMRSTTFSPALGIAAWIKLTVKGAYQAIRLREKRHITFRPGKGVSIEDLREELPNQVYALRLVELRERIGALPEKRRRVAELLLAGHEGGDMAGLLGISYQAAHKLVTNTRTDLLRLMEEDDEAEG